MEKKHCYDTYGRTLAYVFLKDGTCINETMIEEGFAKPYSRYYCEALPLFQKMHLIAKTTKAGLFNITPSF